MMKLLLGCALVALSMAVGKPPVVKVSSKILDPAPGPEDLGAKSPEDGNTAGEGEGVFEGDMVIPKGQKGGTNRNAVKDPNRKWPKKNGIVTVPYVLDDSLGCGGVLAIGQAIEDYAKHTCVHFVPKQGSDHYVRFFKGGGCYSMVGNMQQYYGYREKQDISIGNGCEYKGTTIHEMMHAMGFEHEQSRPDRDQFVSVNFQNVKSDMTHNFDKCNERDCTTQNLPYDYDSVMHYGTNYFTTNGKDTLVPKQAGANIGQRKGFSQMDVQKMNKLYDCDRNSIGKKLAQAPTKMHKGKNCETAIQCEDKYTNCRDYRNYCSYKQVMDGCPGTCKAKGC